MTFQFAHMAPPGATLRRHPVAHWMRDAQTGALVQQWWVPSRPEQAALDALDTPLCALLARQKELRAG
jgi:hypothetical protein